MYPVDLHTHSTASDGVYSPTELLRLAKEAGIQTLGLTDHDTTDGLDEAQKAADSLGITLIPGIELSCFYEDREIHMLGYFLDYKNADFQASLTILREARLRRAEKMLAKLNKVGIKITLDEVLELAKGAIGRPHLARALMNRGYAQSISEAFERYLGQGTPGYVPRFRLRAEEAIQFIRSAHGVPVIAHPATIPGLAHLAPALPVLHQAGLLGLETYYGLYSEAQVEEILALAQANHLLPTGGTDFHGPDVHPAPLGGRFVPESAATGLRALADTIRKQPAPTFTLPDMHL